MVLLNQNERAGRYTRFFSSAQFYVCSTETYTQAWVRSIALLLDDDGQVHFAAYSLHLSHFFHRSFPRCGTRPRRCWGKFSTATPERNSSAAFKRSATWLCSRYSHQWATTNSGRITVKISSG